MIVLGASLSWAADCTSATIADLARIEAPAVLVLGERRGTQPDLGRAARLIARLRVNGAVTVALDSIPTQKQPILDRHARGEVVPRDLEGLLDWGASSGFPWPPYQRLVLGTVQGDRIVGIGAKLEPQPAGAIVPRAPGYASVLSDTMAGHYMPTELEPTFVQAVTWLDHRMALEAMQNWTGKGYLVVVADRLHVEGGKGISWQLQRLVDAPVTTINLGGAGACYAGDVHL